MSTNVTLSLIDRFWAKVDKTGSCWLWTAAVDRKGYGKIGEGGRGSRTLAAHRLSYEFYYGSFDADLCVLHRCDTPRCVRPGHLFLGTRKDNADDMVSKGRSTGQRKTHCKQGHEYLPGAYYQYGSKRVCKACKAAEYQRKRAVTRAIA